MVSYIYKFTIFFVLLTYKVTQFLYLEDIP